MKTRTKDIPPLPSSYDKEYWLDGDVQRISKDKLKNVVCSECKWKLNAKKREVTCDVCGRGFTFQTHQVEEFSDHIEVSTLSGKLKVAIS